MKRVLLTAIVAGIILSLSGCADIPASENAVNSDSDTAVSSNSKAEANPDKSADETANESTDNSPDEGSDANSDNVAVDDDMFTDRDLSGEYSDFTEIKLSGESVTIDNEGTYLLSGSLSDGQIIVNCPDTAKVQLVLGGVDITKSGGAAIYVKSADKVFITIAEGSQNSLTSTGEFVQSDENNVDGVIFAKDDTVINGSGTLNVSSDSAHGIVAKDDLKITGGNINITSAKKGISANDSIRIAGGNVSVTSGTDALHCENAEDSTKGYVYITGGSLKLNAGNDGIDATGYITVKGGDFEIISGGGAEKASRNSDGNSDSFKGIKSDAKVTISGGNFSLDALDDAVHANGDCLISGGSLEIKTGDDGVHSDMTTTVSGGRIDILKSYEGIEGCKIIIGGGDINIVSSDDGINAAGGNDSSGFGGFGGDDFGFENKPDGGRGQRPDNTDNPAGEALGFDFGGFGGGGGMQDGSSEYAIEISGGNITVEAEGDGIDSNGTITMSGGKVFVYGPTNGGNGSLDYGLSATVTGGVFLAAGSSGMAENFGSDSTQCAIMYNLGGNAGSEITLKDSKGETLISATPTKSYQTVIVSCPEIAVGSTYTLTADGQSVEINMTSAIYNAGGTGGHGGRPNRR